MIEGGNSIYLHRNTSGTDITVLSTLPFSSPRPKHSKMIPHSNFPQRGLPLGRCQPPTHAFSTRAFPLRALWNVHVHVRVHDGRGASLLPSRDHDVHDHDWLREELIVSFS